MVPRFTPLRLGLALSVLGVGVFLAAPAAQAAGPLDGTLQAVQAVTGHGGQAPAQPAATPPPATPPPAPASPAPAAPANPVARTLTHVTQTADSAVGNVTKTATDTVNRTVAPITQKPVTSTVNDVVHHPASPATTKPASSSKPSAPSAPATATPAPAPVTDAGHGPSADRAVRALGAAGAGHADHPFAGTDTRTGTSSLGHVAGSPAGPPRTPGHGHVAASRVATDTGWTSAATGVDSQHDASHPSDPQRAPITPPHPHGGTGSPAASAPASSGSSVPTPLPFALIAFAFAAALLGTRRLLETPDHWRSAFLVARIERPG